MIRPLRSVHRGAFVALAVLLPVGIFSALASRVRWEEHRGGWDDGSEPEPPFVSYPRVDVAWESLGTYASIERKPAGLTLRLEPTRDLQRPDVLLYWQPAEAGEELSPEAFLCGTVAGTQSREYPLPDAARTRPGRLVLYSLGHHERVGSASIDLDALRELERPVTHDGGLPR